MTQHEIDALRLTADKAAMAGHFEQYQMLHELLDNEDATDEVVELRGRVAKMEEVLGDASKSIRDLAEELGKDHAKSARKIADELWEALP